MITLVGRKAYNGDMMYRDIIQNVYVTIAFNYDSKIRESAKTRFCKTRLQ